MTIRRRDFLSALAIGHAILCGDGLPMLADEFDDLRTRIGADQADINWSAIRDELGIDPGLAYLNSGGLGCTPKIFLERIHHSNLAFEKNPCREMWADGVAKDLENVRLQVAEFFGVASDELTLTENTTSGLAAIASGITWRPGDEVVLSNHEHLSCVAVWKYYQKRFDLKLVFMDVPVPDFTDEEFIKRFQAKLTPRTKACCLCHVDTMSGVTFPLEAISAITKPLGIFLICDAAQSLGSVPINFRELGVDALAGSGHKWLFGPKGTGLMFIDRQAQNQIKPLNVDWSFAALTPCTGTRNISQLLGWAMIIELQNMIGRNRIEARIRQLSTDLYNRLRQIPKVTPLVNYSPQTMTGLISICLEKSLNSFEIAKVLSSDFRVEIKPLPPANELVASEENRSVEYNAIRFSTHIHNNQADLDQAVNALTAVIKK